jgi:hypothetical protein
VDDQRVRQRLRLRDVVGPQRDDGGGLEDADRCGPRGEDERQARRDEDEEPGGRREAEIKADHQEPERDGEHEPRRRRPEEGDHADARAPQGDEPVHEVRDGRLQAAGEEKRQRSERPDEKADRPVAVDAQDDDPRDEDEGERARQRARSPDRRHLGEPGEREEEEQEEREDIEEALDDDRARRLDARLPSERTEGDDAGRVARAEREHVVEELPDEEGLRGRPERGSLRRREEHAPTVHTDQHSQHEQRARGHEPPVVAPPQRLRELVEVGVPDGQVGERNGDDQSDDDRPVPAGSAPHCRRATQARS